MTRGNPAYAVALGVVLLVVSFLVPGSTRDLILRVVGIAAILAGVVFWALQRRS